MSAKSKGTYYERKVMKVLGDAGYEVGRMAGSLGEFDVVAWDRWSMRLIQVKYVGPNNAHRFTALLEGWQTIPKPSNVSYELWVWQARKGWIVQEAV